MPGDRPVSAASAKSSAAGRASRGAKSIGSREQLAEMVMEALLLDGPGGKQGGTAYFLRCRDSDEVSERNAFQGLVKSLIPREAKIEAGDTLADVLGRTISRGSSDGP